jgi:hypothetical protein
MYFSAQVSEMGAMIGSVETGVQTLYDGVRDRFHAWRRRSRLCQKSSRPHRQVRERACRLQAICGRAKRNEGILGRVEALEFLTRFATSPVASISVGPRGRYPLAEGL